MSFSDDDPRRDAPWGMGDQCDMEHRLDLGCPLAGADGSGLIVWLVLGIVGVAAAFAWVVCHR